MLRANRHFLPGHLSHITHRCQRKFVQNVQAVQSLRSVQDVWGERKLPRFSRLVTGAAICVGFSKQRSGSVCRCSITWWRPTTFIFWSKTHDQRLQRHSAVRSVGTRAPSSYTLIYRPAAFRNLSAAGPRFATYRVGSHARLDSRRA